MESALGSSRPGVAGFDLVVAADVVIYFGRIDGLLRAFAGVSAPGAGLIFSCELATEEEAPRGWRLLPTKRFAHTKKYAVEAGAEAGYELVSYLERSPRMENGEPVPGHQFTFVLKDERGHSEL